MSNSEITLGLTEEEIPVLLDALAHFSFSSVGDEKRIVERLRKKTEELYDDHVAEYYLSAACSAYMEKYGETPNDDEKWETFRDAYNMAMKDWVQRAGRDQIKKKAQAIYNAFDEATDRLDLKDGEVLRFVLMEVINQLQEGTGLIPAPTLYLVAQCIAEMGDGND